MHSMRGVAVPPKPLSGRWPWIAMAAVMVAAAAELHHQGRPWWCACGSLSPWAGAHSSHTSQHLVDPYSVTHMLHGFVIWLLLTWTFPRLTPTWRLALTVFFEAAWEIVENSTFVIERYRTATMALGYRGDSIVNSLGDIVCGGIGCVIAGWLGPRRSILVFALTEGILLVTIRDSLLLNVVMLISPVDAIKAWQLAP
jgi:hypothetical protein